MAATRLIVLHENKGKTILQALKARIDYAQNPEKTENGELVISYECDPRTAAEEFLLAKRNYEQSTGNRKGRNVLAYQIRQSFLPGEITPEEANRVGYELAMTFTKGRHAFTVSTHTDRKHIHNHIIFNAVTLDEKRKFQNFFNSFRAVQRASDRICLEHGLSIIESRRKPEPIIVEMPENLKSKRKIRTDSSEEPLSMLIDIQEKLREGKGKGYEIWAKKFNLKQMAQALCFLQENGIESYEDLVKKKKETSDCFEKISGEIRDIEEKLSELTELRNHIFNYAKTRDVYNAYRASGWSRGFFESHREEITLYRAAKKAFEQQKTKKIPKVKEINSEFNRLVGKKKLLYAEYRDLKKQNRQYLIAEKNVTTILGMDEKNEKDDHRRPRKNEKTGRQEKQKNENRVGLSR